MIETIETQTLRSTVSRQRCFDILNEFDDSLISQAYEALERLRLEAEDMEYCVDLYDAAKANDDGYSISSEDLRAKYGL